MAVRFGWGWRLLVGERGEPVGRLVGERVGALGLEDVPGPRVAPPERDPTLGGERLVAVVAAREHHVDDGLERRLEQHLERGIDLGPVLVGDLVAMPIRRQVRGRRVGDGLSSHGP